MSLPARIKRSAPDTLPHSYGMDGKWLRKRQEQKIAVKRGRRRTSDPATRSFPSTLNSQLLSHFPNHDAVAADFDDCDRSSFLNEGAVGDHVDEVLPHLRLAGRAQD